MSHTSIRLAEIYDTEPLSILNNQWQGSVLADEVKIKSGFLSAAFSTSDFLILINNKEVVVVESDQNIVAYYLLNNFIETPKFLEGQEVIRKLKIQNKIAAEATVGLGAQVLIEPQFRGKGLSQQMLRLLCENILCKYEYLYSSINKLNEKSIKSNIKNRWRIADENDTHFFVLLQTKDFLKM